MEIMTSNLGLSLKPTRNYLFLLLVFLLMPGTDNLQAQSFLSNPKTITEQELQDKTNDARDLQTEIFEEDENNESDETVDLVAARELEFNLESLAGISLLINKGEYGLALAMLQELKTEFDENLSQDTKFRLQELRQYLSIKANYYLGDYNEVVIISQKYIRYYSNGDHYYHSFYFFASALHYLEKPLEYTSLVTDDFF